MRAVAVPAVQLLGPRHHRGHLDRNAQAAVAQGALRGLQSGDHGQTLLTAAQRLAATADAVEEVLALEPERLPPGDVRDDDLSVAGGGVEIAPGVRGRTPHPPGRSR